MPQWKSILEGAKKRLIVEGIIFSILFIILLYFNAYDVRLNDYRYDCGTSPYMDETDTCKQQAQDLGVSGLNRAEVQDKSVQSMGRVFLATMGLISVILFEVYTRFYIRMVSKKLDEIKKPQPDVLSQSSGMTNPKFQELLPDEKIVETYIDKMTKWYSNPKNMVALRSSLRFASYDKGALFITNKAIVYETFNGDVSHRYTYGLIEKITGMNGKGRRGWGGRDVTGDLEIVFIGGRSVSIAVGEGGDIAERINAKCHSSEFDELGNSEIINTCNRCERQWFMNPTELDEFEKGRVSIRASGVEALQVGLVMLHFGVAAGQRLSTEKTISSEAQATRYAEERVRLEAKFVCPDCSSTDITRNISKKGEKLNKPKKKIVRKSSGDDKLAKLKELQMMYKDGLIDKEEFSKLKKDIIG